jgi:hypothetical protein
VTKRWDQTARIIEGLNEAGRTLKINKTSTGNMMIQNKLFLCPVPSQELPENSSHNLPTAAGQDDSDAGPDEADYNAGLDDANTEAAAGKTNKTNFSLSSPPITAPRRSKRILQRQQQPKFRVA